MYFIPNVMESKRTVPTREVTRLGWVLAVEEAWMAGGGEVEEAEEAKRVSYNKKSGWPKRSTTGKMLRTEAEETER